MKLREGVELGQDVIGGCVAKDLQSYITAEKKGYIADMVWEAKHKALQKLASINKAVKNKDQ